MVPRNISCSPGRASGVSCRTPSTVAELKASTSPAMAVAGHVVICAGNDMSRNILPAMAGLKMLFPKPPKVSFTTPIANKHPSAKIHIGRFEGTLKASNTPVMMADPSRSWVPSS